jgi:hypothetical protein
MREKERMTRTLGSPRTSQIRSARGDSSIRRGVRRFWQLAAESSAASRRQRRHVRAARPSGGGGGEGRLRRVWRCDMRFFLARDARETAGG